MIITAWCQACMSNSGWGPLSSLWQETQPTRLCSSFDSIYTSFFCTVRKTYEASYALWRMLRLEAARINTGCLANFASRKRVGSRLRSFRLWLRNLSVIEVNKLSMAGEKFKIQSPQIRSSDELVFPRSCDIHKEEILEDEHWKMPTLLEDSLWSLKYFFLYRRVE